jgi:hypothetical protein
VISSRTSVSNSFGYIALIAALLHNFDKISGVELLQPLHDHAVAVHTAYRIKHPEPKPEIVFTQGSMVDFDWASADVVLCCNVW